MDGEILNSGDGMDFTIEWGSIIRNYIDFTIVLLYVIR